MDCLQMPIFCISELSTDLLGSCPIAVTVAELIQLPACRDQRETLFEVLVSLAENGETASMFAKNSDESSCNYSKSWNFY